MGCSINYITHLLPWRIIVGIDVINLYHVPIYRTLVGTEREGSSRLSGNTIGLYNRVIYWLNYWPIFRLKSFGGEYTLRDIHAELGVYWYGTGAGFMTECSKQTHLLLLRQTAAR